MSIARHHAEWLSLLEVSGPFVTMPVLLRVFPQGLDAHDPELHRTLRLAYEEWSDNQGGLRPESAIHTQWVRWVLATVLEMPAEALVEGPAIPPGLSAAFADHGETLRPDFALLDPDNGKPRLLVRYYPAAQDLDKPLPGYQWKATPATRMMELLRACDVRLGLVTNGERWMLVDAPRQETTGFASWYANLWLEEPLTLRSFRSLLALRRFFGVAEGDTIEAMLRESASNQQEVTDQLGYQVRRAVEMLVGALDRVDKDYGRRLLAGLQESDLYEAAVTVMMRLVFLLSAEERKLLLLGDPLYDQYYAVSTLRAQLREQADQTGEEVLERRYDAWSRLLAVFRVVYGGVEHADMRLPAYGGRLFDPDRFPFLEGRAPGTGWRDTPAAPVQINNRAVLHLLDALQLLQVKVPGGGPAEARRLSFRALDIEQIGHVYEGLLDHTARRATEPVLGLVGQTANEPEVALARLEELTAQGEKALLDFLTEETGRSASPLKKLAAYQPDGFAQDRLRRVADNDESLYRRLLPFAGLIRLDSFGLPVVITPGSVYVTQGSDRRSTGTHYTPRSLTEPVVQYALEPLVYRGPAEGWPRAEWQLRSAEEILDLTVCDMAMGSGAFLVQACRYLSERLVEAWDAAGLTLPDDDSPIENRKSKIENSDDERLSLARRLVAKRCLYGVDKNPMAVEMAKLSLWLITLDRGRPFTFLDHALRHGDSLLGASLGQLRTFSMDEDLVRLEGGRQAHFIEEALNNTLAAAIRLRHQISRLNERDARDTEAKALLLQEAEELTALLKLGADLLVAYALRGQSVPTELQLHFSVLTSAYEEAARRRAASQSPAAYLTGYLDESARAQFAELRAEADTMLRDRQGQPRQPFHWPLEFPEVFAATRAEAGFAALIGNPPFQGGKMITGALGTDYRDYLVKRLAGGKRGSADLCAYFFLRAGDLVQAGGMAGLIATNTIAQGDTREVGLDQLVEKGWSIPRAVPSRRWPGEAALEVAHIWLRRGDWHNEFNLDDKPAAGITAFLTAPGTVEGKPYQLETNAGKSFIGSYVLGMGFVLELEEVEDLIAKDPRNKEVLFPYLNGEDLNSRSGQLPSRWVINFFNWPLEKAETYPDCIAIVREKVKPERDKNNKKPYREKWWQFAERCPGLYATIAGMEQVLVKTRHSPTCAFSIVSTNVVFQESLVVLASNSYVDLAVLSTSMHEQWAWNYGSTLGSNTLRYSPSDCFETFPFPENMDGLESIGEEYYQHRQAIMTARQEGLTKTYNRFHNPEEGSAEIVRLRELHREMDIAVAAAYGWRDLDLGHDFHDTKQGLRYTISESARREVLGRLLTLNHARHAQEVAAGLHDKGKKKGAGARGQKSETRNQEPGARGAGVAARAEAGPSKIENHQSPNGEKSELALAPAPAPDAATQSKIENRKSKIQDRLFEVEPAGSLWESVAAPAAPPEEPPPAPATTGETQSKIENRLSPDGGKSKIEEVRAWTGSVVTVQPLGPAGASGPPETYTLITERESKTGLKEKKGHPVLSIQTPLGMRLLDKQAGDRVSYKDPTGQPRTFQVLRVD